MHKLDVHELGFSHHPSSTVSNRALELLRSALTNRYPQGDPKARPLDFDLEVVETPPTPEQFRTILSYLPQSSASKGPSAFISTHPSSADVMSGSVGSGQVTPKTLTELARANPNAVKWPIVVDWNGGRASVGDVDGVRAILDAIRKEQS